MKQVDGIIGVSEFVAASAVTVGCQPGRVFHALNSLDASQWDYHIDGSLIRREFHIPSDTLVFTIVGRVALGKGHDLVLKALAQIKDRIPDFRFMIVGEDTSNPLTGQSYVADLREQVRDLGLSQQVIFTGQRSDIPTILAACDLYTMPALDEGFCLAILEAMAMKKAVIALDNGGPREFVEHGKSGLLSRPDDVEQLAENILTLVNDVNLREQMGTYARQRVDEYFTPQRLANEVEQIYRLVLKGACAPDRQSVMTMVEA
jgi:glycosyltransferase involved in cell wall biosynthesis